MAYTSLLGLIAGVVADRLIPDPSNKWHPVAVFGQYAGWLEKKLYRPTKKAGAIYVATCVLPPVVGAGLVAKYYPRLSLGFSLWAALGGTTLERIGSRMANTLETHDLAAARELVPWLCSRDPQILDTAGVARATVESLAENTSDAAIAPIVWAVAGAPGVVLHRTVNTLDAMVGYKNDQYQEFGWAAAKLDDLLAFIPARLTAALHVGYATAYGRGREALHAWRYDAPSHPSPNAGLVEATAAAAIGVQLGGQTHYRHGVELRPILGTGEAPNSDSIRKAVSLSKVTQFGAATVVGMMLAKKRLV